MRWSMMPGQRRIALAAAAFAAALEGPLRIAAWVLVLAVASLAPAAVADTPLTASEFKMAGNATAMRVVLQFDREPNPRWFLLRGPHRLVMDLPDTNFFFDGKALKGRGLIRNVRYGPLNEGNSRLILSAKGPFAVDKVDVLADEAGKGYRLAIELTATSDRKFEQALADQAETTGSTTAAGKADRLGKPRVEPGKRFAVVIDPGHGGIDGGAEGRNGTVEKAITLTFGMELRDKLAATGQYDVFMTRETDVFRWTSAFAWRGSTTPTSSSRFTPIRSAARVSAARPSTRSLTKPRTPRRRRLPTARTCRMRWPASTSNRRITRSPTFWSI
jgi:N-acetylmuramoyl-L-alanine amidase